MWTIVLGALAVLVAGAAAAAGLVLVRRRVPLARLEGHDDIVGFVYGAVAMLYAVLATFVLVAAWERYSDAELALEQEADQLVALVRDADALPVSVGAELRAELRAHGVAVIEQEWAAMRTGGESAEAEAALRRAWRLVLAFSPGSDVERAATDRLFERLEALGDLRTQRLAASRSRLPAVLWAMLVAGAVATVASTYLFATTRIGKHALIAAILAGTIAGVLYVTACLDGPFQRPGGIEPEALRLALEEMRHWEGGAAP